MSTNRTSFLNLSINGPFAVEQQNSSTNAFALAWEIDLNFEVIDSAIESLTSALAGGSIAINGALVNAPNFQNSSTVTFSVSGHNITATATLATVATTGAYSDLSGKPVLPANTNAVSHQFVTAYNSATGAFTQAQPAATDVSGLATVATSGSYTDLSSKPTLPVTDSGSAHQFLTSYDASTGLFAKGQPAYTDISGSIAIGQTPLTTLGDTLYVDSTPALHRLAGNITTTKMYLSQTGNGAISAAPAWAQINYADITGTVPTPPSGSVLWSALGNAGADLSLSNEGFNTTFNQTSAVNWTWANTTVGTVGSTNASPLLNLAANYWATGAVAGVDSWSLGIAALTAGLNSPSTLTFTHSGSTGVAAVRVPLLDIGGTDAGISRRGAASLAVGNGTAGDASGTLSCVEVTTGSAQLLLQQTGDTFGTTQLALRNSVGSAGAIFINSGLDLVDLGFLTSTSKQFNLRYEHRNIAVLSANSAGEMQIIDTTGGSKFVAEIGTGVASFAASVLAIGSPYVSSLPVPDAGISRLGAASLAIGNGTAGDFSGSLKFTTLTLAGLIGTYNGVATVKQGVAPILAAPARLVSQTAAQSAVSLVASALAGMYRISYCSAITTASDISSVLGGTTGFAVTYTDPQDSVAKTSNPTTPTKSAANTTGTTVSGNLYVYAKAATAITFNFGYTDSHTSQPMVYNLACYAEYLG